MKQNRLSLHYKSAATLSKVLPPSILILLLTAAVIFSLEPAKPKQYHYEKQLATGGVELHIIRTTPDNIQLQPIDNNVTNTPYYGVNGGFFWEGALLSIAVINGRPLKGDPGDYGSGWYNTGVDGNLRRGTLVWDEALSQFSVQVVNHAGELIVSDGQRFWAQGGVSMHLGQPDEWAADMIAEQMPGYDEGHMRTGLVYDSRQQLYMIVTPTFCTIEQFRTAILQALGRSGIVDGIYLDGDGSSQLQTRFSRLAGDHRPVYQMLALKR